MSKKEKSLKINASFGDAIKKLSNSDMAKVSPTHSINSTVYHNNRKCTERNNIEDSNKRQGKGGRKLCSHCKRLNDQGK